MLVVTVVPLLRRGSIEVPSGVPSRDGTALVTATLCGVAHSWSLLPSFVALLVRARHGVHEPPADPEPLTGALAALAPAPRPAGRRAQPLVAVATQAVR